MPVPSLDPSFHVYPTEDVLKARIMRARLDKLERAAIYAMVPFVRDHRVALALSFGKDSMTCLHLAHVAGVLSRIVIVMWNASGIDNPDTLAMRDYVVERYGLRNYVETTPDEETLRRTTAKVDRSAKHPTEDFVYECIEQPRWRMMDAHNINGTIMGLRAGESTGRRINFRVRGNNYWNKREKAQILTPLAKWRTEDVFVYCASRGVPLHPSYHQLPQLGFDRMHVRVSSPVNMCMWGCEEALAYKRLHPSAYQRLLEYVPSIRP